MMPPPTTTTTTSHVRQHAVYHGSSHVIGCTPNTAAPGRYAIYLKVLKGMVDQESHVVNCTPNTAAPAR